MLDLTALQTQEELDERYEMTLRPLVTHAQSAAKDAHLDQQRRKGHDQRPTMAALRESLGLRPDGRPSDSIWELQRVAHEKGIPVSWVRALTVVAFGENTHEAKFDSKASAEGIPSLMGTPLPAS